MFTRPEQPLPVRDPVDRPRRGDFGHERRSHASHSRPSRKTRSACVVGRGRLGRAGPAARPTRRGSPRGPPLEEHRAAAANTGQFRQWTYSGQLRAGRSPWTPIRFQQSPYPGADVDIGFHHASLRAQDVAGARRPACWRYAAAAPASPRRSAMRARASRASSCGVEIDRRRSGPPPPSVARRLADHPEEEDARAPARPGDGAIDQLRWPPRTAPDRPGPRPSPGSRPASRPGGRRRGAVARAARGGLRGKSVGAAGAGIASGSGQGARGRGAGRPRPGLSGRRRSPRAARGRKGEVGDSSPRSAWPRKRRPPSAGSAWRASRTPGPATGRRSRSGGSGRTPRRTADTPRTAPNRAGCPARNRTSDLRTSPSTEYRPACSRKNFGAGSPPPGPRNEFGP